MTIINGNPVLSFELTTLNSTSREDLRSTLQRSPGGLYITANFPQLVDGLPAASRRMKFVVPFDIYVESLCVQTSPGNATSATITVDVTGDGVMPPWAMRVQENVSTAGIKKMTRLLFDNGGVSNPGVNPTTLSRAMRLLPKGTTITISASTTNTLVTMEAVIVLACRQYKGREYA